MALQFSGSGLGPKPRDVGGGGGGLGWVPKFAGTFLGCHRGYVRVLGGRNAF